MLQLPNPDTEGVTIDAVPVLWSGPTKMESMVLVSTVPAKVSLAKVQSAALERIGFVEIISPSPTHSYSSQATRHTLLTNLHAPTAPDYTQNSPPKLLLFQSPKDRETDRAERKRQLEAHVAAVARIPDQLADRADEPHLRHAHDRAEDPEAEGEHGCDPGGEQARVVPDGDVVFALLEDEVLGQGDAFVDG